MRKRLRRGQVLAFFKTLPSCLIGMGVRHGALLGAGADKARSQGSVDAGEGCAIDARASVIVLAAHLQAVQALIGSNEKRIKARHRANQASKRLETIPGIGVIGATAMAATVADPTVFRSGRDFAAWVGLVPRQGSTRGKHKLGPISQQGDRYMRRIEEWPERLVREPKHLNRQNA